MPVLESPLYSTNGVPIYGKLGRPVYSQDFIYIKCQMPVLPNDTNGDPTSDIKFSNAVGYNDYEGIWWSDPAPDGEEYNSLIMYEIPPVTGRWATTEPYVYMINLTAMIANGYGKVGENDYYEIVLRAALIDISYFYPDPVSTNVYFEAWVNNGNHQESGPLAMTVLDIADYPSGTHPETVAVVGKLRWTPATSTLEFILP